MSEFLENSFRSKAWQMGWSLDSVDREQLKEFLESGSFESARDVCRAAFPASEFYGSYCWPDGEWTAEILYDNLLYDGEGPTEAAALIDAIKRISRHAQDVAARYLRA
jgi:hypothetical protein